MDCKVLDIFIEHLTNERLDNIIFQDEEYKVIDAKLGQIMQSFEELLQYIIFKKDFTHFS